jgi:chromosome segregation ATPase
MSSIDLSADLKLARLELEVAEAKHQLAIEANVQNVRDLAAKDEYIEILTNNLEPLRQAVEEKDQQLIRLKQALATRDSLANDLQKELARVLKELEDAERLETELSDQRKYSGDLQKKLSAKQRELDAAVAQIGILVSNYEYYKGLYYAEAKKAATLSDALGNARSLLTAQETMARHADSEPTLEGVLTNAFVTGIKAGIGDFGRAAEAAIPHPVGTKIPPRTCMYCGEGQMVGIIVVASKPNEDDYHLDPAVCRHRLLEHSKALQSRIFDLEGEIAGFRNFELPEKDKRIEQLETQLDAWKHSSTSAHNELANKAKRVEAIETELSLTRKELEVTELKLEAALGANRAHVAASHVLVHGVPLDTLSLPTDQASWDRVATFIDRALVRHNRINP